MKMTKKQLLDYTKSIKFWLKDFEKTKSKYQNYKKEIDLVFLSDCRQGGVKRDFESELSDFIFQKAYKYSRVQTLKEKLENWEYTKSNIRSLKTTINSLTLEFNKNFVEWYHDDLELSKNHKLYIRYYVENYEKINEAMQNILFDFVETFTK